MCRSQAEGGQRCASHARETLQRAEKRYTDAFAAAKQAQADGSPEFEKLKADSMDLYNKWEEALANYASSPEGEAELRQEYEALGGSPYGRKGDPDPYRAGELYDALNEGRHRRERNAAIRAAAASPSQRP